MIFLHFYTILRIIRQQKPDIINASTPKAGLLGMLASYVARVPKRIYQLRGPPARNL